MQVLERDPEAESRARRDLLEFAESLTPDFELTTPDTLLLDLRGCLVRQSPDDGGSPVTRHSSLVTDPSRAAGLGLPLHLATAATPDLAHLFALAPATSHCLVFRGADSRWKPPRARDDGALRHLPLALLRHCLLDPSELAGWDALAQWGLRHLGDFAALPRQGLAERIGPGFARLHDLLHGKVERPLQLFHPPESLEARWDFEHPVDQSTALLFPLRRCLGLLANRLHQRYRSATAILLELQLENQPPHHKSIRLPEPSASPEVLLRPLETHLEVLQLPAPVTHFTLTLVPGEPHDGQHQLFGQQLRQPHRLADTLARLEALVGPERLGFPVPAFSHRPDSFHLLPAHRLFSGGNSTTDHSSLVTGHSRAAGLPLSRFRPPVEVAVAFEKDHPFPRPLALLTGPHRGRIRDTRGPFPISGHWWDPAERWQQLEWDIELESHQLLRLAHLPPSLWQLQGAYP